MKHRAFKFVIIFLLLASVNLGSVMAHGDSETSIDSVLNEIKSGQNVSDIEDIDCDKVSDEHLEELGDLVMEIRHPDEEEHSLMDAMMGGEGSDSLEAMHITMGQNYLGCFDNERFGMMGSGMGMMGSNWGDNMMGNLYDSDDSVNTTTLVVLVLLSSFVGITLGAGVVILLTNKKDNTSTKDNKK